MIMTTLTSAEHLKTQISLGINSRFIDTVEAFLGEKNREYRKIYAEEAIRALWAIWGTDRKFEPYLTKFKTAENAGFIFDDFHRDHLVHSLYVYLLGQYLICICKKLKKYTWDQIPLFLFSWGMAATLHDIAYPLELYSKQISNYLGKRRPKLAKAAKLRLTVELEGLVDIGKRDLNLWDVLNKHLIEKYNIRSFNIERYFENKCAREGIIDHGVMSSLIVLKYFYEGGEFDDVILDVASAIVLHNINRRGKLDVRLKENGLAYLLILSDELQEWDRPSITRDVIPSKGVLILKSAIPDIDIECSYLLTSSEIDKKQESLFNKIRVSDISINISGISFSNYD